MKKNNRAIPFKSIPQAKENHIDAEKTNKPVMNCEIKHLSQYGHIRDFLRYSSERIPDTQYLIKNSGIPFGIHFTPFINGMNDLKSISIGNERLSSCSKCGTFINSHCIIDAEEKWKCNMCSNVNNPLSSTDKLIKDHDVVELFASSDYIERPPMEPSFVFIIDVSKKSIESGFLSVVINAIKFILNNKAFLDEERTNVAFITYDDNINLFEVNKKTHNIQILSVYGDEAFLPQKDNSLLISFDENRTQLNTLIDTIEEIYSPNKITTETIKDSNKVITAIEIGKLLLHQTGGKLIVTNASTDWLKALNDNNTHQHHNANDEYLKEVGQQSARYQICLDIFQAQLTKESQNITLLNTICNYSNGYYYLYNSFNLEIHSNSLYNQIILSITKSTCSEILMSITHSSEVALTKLLTPVPIQVNNKIIIPQIDSNNSYSFLINYLSIPNDAKSIPLPLSSSLNRVIHIQCSIIYTHSDCSRRIRVFNLMIQKCVSLEEYYRYIDVESSIVFITKLFIQQLNTGISISNALAEVNQLYFNSALSGLKDTQCHELLHQFLLCYIGLMKNRICCVEVEKNKINNDMLNYSKLKILKSKVEEVMSLILPKIYNITEVIQGNCLFDNVYLTPCLCNSNSIQSDQVYLIDNGQYLILHFTEGNVNKQLIEVFFGEGMTFEIVGSYFHSERSVFEDPINKDKDEIQRVEKAINDLREKKCYYQELFFSFEGCLSETMYIIHLISNIFRVKESLIQNSICPWFNYSFNQYLKKI